jgi:tetratricopeptide (TPR) repeat protein
VDRFGQHGGLIGLFVIWSLLGAFSPRVQEAQLRMTGTHRHPLALSNQAAIELNMGRFKHALDLSERAIGIDAECHPAWCNKGLALLHLGKPEEAEAAFREALRLDSGAWQTWHNQGAMLQSQGKHEDAQTCMQEAYRLRAGNRTAAWACR